MKKIFTLLTIAVIAFTASAQKLHTSMVDFNKSQYPGYLFNIKNVSVETLDATLRDIFENQYNLKASKESGFRTYRNQQFAPFGQENYDIFFNVIEFGKKNEKTTQLVLLVCKGNMNAVTASTDPQVDAAIRKFLQKMPSKVDEYQIRKPIIEKKEQIAKLETSKQSLLKEQEKINGQIEKLQLNLNDLSKKIEENNASISKLQEEVDALEQLIKEK